MGYSESAVRIRIRVRIRVRFRVRFRVRIRVGLGLDSVRGSTISHKMKYLPLPHTKYKPVLGSLLPQLLWHILYKSNVKNTMPCCRKLELFD